jgi:hypothetical protein
VFSLIDLGAQKDVEIPDVALLIALRLLGELLELACYRWHSQRLAMLADGRKLDASGGHRLTSASNAS